MDQRKQSNISQSFLFQNKTVSGKKTTHHFMLNASAMEEPSEQNTHKHISRHYCWVLYKRIKKNPQGFDNETSLQGLSAEQSFEWRQNCKTHHQFSGDSKMWIQDFFANSQRNSKRSEWILIKLWAIGQRTID